MPTLIHEAISPPTTKDEAATKPHKNALPAPGQCAVFTLICNRKSTTSQNVNRVPWLVPIRHGRMSESPFAFYRGAAKIMAADLGTTPATGPIAQICGDAASQK